MTSSHRYLAAALTAAALLAITPLPASAQYAAPPPGAQGVTAQVPYTTLPLGLVLGRDGYFEVTPAGSLVFYPVWSSVDPGVMHTILAMMGATSLVSERGTYRVLDGQVQFFLPPGSTPGLGGIGQPPQLAPPAQPPRR